MAPMISQTMIMTDPIRMTASDGMFAGVAPCEQQGLPQSRECRQRRWIDMLADSFSQHIHIPVKAIRGQTDMSNPGKTHHRSRSHQDRRPVQRYSWTAAERRSASVMMFAVSGCFRDEVARVSWEVKVRRHGIATPRPGKLPGHDPALNRPSAHRSTGARSWMSSRGSFWG
jgi:hypothetical protein